MQIVYPEENSVAVTNGYMSLIKCQVTQTFGRMRSESDYHLQGHQIREDLQRPFVWPMHV